MMRTGSGFRSGSRPNDKDFVSNTDLVEVMKKQNTEIKDEMKKMKVEIESLKEKTQEVAFVEEDVKLDNVFFT